MLTGEDDIVDGRDGICGIDLRGVARVIVRPLRQTPR